MSGSPPIASARPERALEPVWEIARATRRDIVLCPRDVVARRLRCYGIAALLAPSPKPKDDVAAPCYFPDRLLASDRGGAVIERHRVRRLGEEEPAFDQHSRRADERAGECGRRGDGAPAQRRRKQYEGQGEAGRQRDAPEPRPVLARDAEAHLLEQEIGLAMRRLKEAHAALEPGGVRRGEARRGAV